MEGETHPPFTERLIIIVTMASSLARPIRLLMFTLSSYALPALTHLLSFVRAVFIPDRRGRRVGYACLD